MKFVVSFTTSPSRIDKIKPMIDSILNQTIQPDLFLLNIPRIFHRTGEKYNIPDFVTDNVVINTIEHDLGPATKIIPTISYVQTNHSDWNETETFLIYVDDDIKYQDKMMEVFHNMYSEDTSTRIMGCSGGDLHLNPNRECHIEPKRQHNAKVDLIEGFASVCVPLVVFGDDIFSYIELYTTGIAMRQCLLSDDIILSNYYSKRKTPMYIINCIGKHSKEDLWSQGRVLEYGNKEDALHLGASNQSCGNLKRYYFVLDILTRNNDLYIPVHNHVIDMHEYILALKSKGIHFPL